MQGKYNDKEECKILKQCKGANQQTLQRATNLKFNETSLCVT